MGLVPRDRGAESELSLDCASLTSFHNFGEPVRVACNGLNTIITMPSRVLVNRRMGMDLTINSIVRSIPIDL